MILVILLLCLFLQVTLGFYIFAAAPRMRAHQTFAAFIACLALWTVKDIIFWEFLSTDSFAFWWAGASFTLSLALQFFLMVFAWVFPENLRTPRKKAAVIFAPALVLIPATFAGMLWYRVGLENGKFIIEPAPLAYAFVVYVYAIFVYGAYILYQKYRKYRGTQQGQQLGAVMWGVGLTAVLMTTANIALPWFGLYYLLPLSSIFALPGALVFAFAISNFKLFSFQTALDEFRLFPIAYKVALSIAVVAVLSFAIFQIPIVIWAFQDGMNYEAWRKYLTFSLITALVPNLILVLLIVRSISRPLRRITLAAVAVTEGDYGTQVSENSNDEIGILARSFNEMSRKMAADIEQLQKLNEQLIRTEKLAAMGTLSAGVAHEVNNPLASISSLIQIMQSKANLDGETRDRLGLISTQISRISQVTRDMMDFARTNPLPGIAVRSAANINELIEAGLRLAAFDKAFQKLHIFKDLDASLPRIHADPDQLQQVFLNLFLNARDAMPEGGELKITTSYPSENGHLSIEISDTGTGIDPKHVKQVFDPFFTTKPAGQGTGLGLAVCYGIVTAHGGKIEALPVDTGGTMFSITLPVNES
ncbi:MAG TPA: ATP-binding protein [Pyrinomonadaceae bacterium]|jgi:signal transduction histidine kinase|nr:ATP-binding protein [Pyrinomonadaceae bacterium]